MKKSVYLFILLLQFSTILAQQAPQKFNYQAVARDSDGKALVDSEVILRIAIMSGNDLDRPLYAEEHLVLTNKLGLFNLAIGSGEVIEGEFSAIDWGADSHYLSVEMDAEGHGNFQQMGTSQLLSVPYALYAEKSGSYGVDGGSRSDPNDWTINGNAGTDDATNFIGTTDAQDLVLRADNAEVARFTTDSALQMTSGGRILFGTYNAVNMDGERNIHIGERAGDVSTGNQNAFIGYNAGQVNTTGEKNTFIGPTAGRVNTTGNQNSFIGGRAGFNNTSGSQNSFIGWQAGRDNTTGTQNTFIGKYAGLSNTTGSSNTYIGKEADGSPTLSNATAIGAGATVTQDSSVVLGNSANVGIGTSAPEAKLHVEGTLKLVDGTQEDGYVLTSDSLGNASWQTASVQASLMDADSDTKIQVEESTDEDHIRFDVAGSEAMVIDNTGNVGVGTSSPSSTLHVTMAQAEVLDQDQTASTGNSDGALSAGWQSFTAGITGNLTKVTWYFDYPYSNARTFRIYEGEGTGGTLLFESDEYSSVSATQEVPITGVQVEAGQQYTMRISKISGWKIHLSDQYSGGRSNQSASWDFNFSTYVEEDDGGFRVQSSGVSINDYTLPVADGTTGQVMTTDGAGTLSWADASSVFEAVSDTLTIVSDADSDTKIQVEESSDEDIIRFDVGGSEVMSIENNANGYTTFKTGSSSGSLHIGDNAGVASTTATNNVFVGNGSASLTTTGGSNTAVGSSTFFTNTTGFANTVMGFQAGAYNQSGNYNTFIGTNSGLSNVSGGRNVYVGNGSGGSATGSQNVSLGYEAGSSTTGSNSVFLGYQAGKDDTGSNILYIESSSASSTDALIYGEFDNDWVRIGGYLTPEGGVADTDNDTKIQVEESADEDIIRMDVEGTEIFDATLDNSEIIQTDLAPANVPDGVVSIKNATLLLDKNSDDSNTEQALVISGKLPGGSYAYARIDFENIDSDQGNVDYLGASIRSHNSGSSDDGDLRFHVAEGQTLFEAMRIDINGYVGIGSTSPNAELHIDDADSDDAWLLLTQSSTGSTTADGFEIGVNSDEEAHLNNKEATNMVFSTNNTERLTITSDGNVGIGTSTPLHELQIYDSVNDNAWIQLVQASTGTTQSDGLVIGINSSEEANFINKEATNMYFKTDNTDRMTIEADGNVGIGTTTTSDILHISGSGGTRLRAESTTNDYAGLLAKNSARNIFIGVQGSSDPNPGEFHIYDNTAGARRMAITAAGNVGFGYTNPSYKLQVNGQVAGTSAYVNTSDAKYKTNVRPIDSALDKVAQLQGVGYDWKTKDFPEKNFDTRHQLGFIAQEVENVVPEAVSMTNEGDYGLSYSTFIPLLVEAVKELKKENDALRIENRNLTDNYTSLSSDVEMLKALLSTDAQVTQ